MFKKTLITGTMAVITLVSAAVPAFAATSQVSALGAASSTPSAAQVAVVAISPEEAASLQFMREEEKLAHDVYAALYEQWGLALFDNIAASERNHTDAIASLLDLYGVADPAADKGPGEFTNEDLQALYDELAAQGSQSLADAIKVGATIEEVDILDLQARLDETGTASIRQVYSNLVSGSENHLRAFVSTLKIQTGETYVPQYLSQAAYDAIISAAGNQGGGNGSGNRGGGGGRR